MKGLVIGAVGAALLLASCTVRAEVVYLSDQYPPDGVWYWYGTVPSQEQGNIVDLAGTSRWLQSVTLDNFYTDWGGGQFEVTASIYTVPSEINDGDLLSNPLWSETEFVSYAMGSYQYHNIYFPTPEIQLPDKVVLDFSFTSVSGDSAAIFLQNYYSFNGEPNNPPAIGDVAVDVEYNGGWQHQWPGMALYAMGQMNATSTPDPATILTLSFGLACLSALRRRRRS